MKRRACVARARAWVARHGSLVLLLAGAAMVLGALWRLGHALPFLMWVAEAPHPTDLLARHGEVSRWFDGIPPGPLGGTPDYPPASYVLLWPLLGWLDVGPARWLWAVTAMAALSLLAVLAVEEGGRDSGAHRLFLFALPFAGYGTSATLTVGQVGNHVVPALVAGLLLLQVGRGRWWADVGAALLILFALMKPTLSAPFVWIACFATGRVRPGVLVIAGYLAVTLFAASFQPGDLSSILTAWLGNTPGLLRGTANLHKVLHLMGLGSWIIPATLATLLGFGWWVWRHRSADLWVLMGVAALVARLGFHHRVYDDVLLLIPTVALFRLAVSGEEERDGDDPLAWVLLALTWATICAPAQVFRYPQPFPALMETWQGVVWVAVLVFLLGAARPTHMGGPGNRSKGRA